MLDKIGVTLHPQEKKHVGKHLFNVIMKKWLSISDAILEMMVYHLPSPKEAQRYRYSYLYEGPKDDVCALAMKNCDS